MKEYLVYDKETDELVDVIELFSDKVDKYLTDNPEIYLEESSELDDDYINEDDYYNEEFDDED